MPALTRRGKRLLPEDLEDEEDGLENVDAVGILAQRAARREAAQEQDVPLAVGPVPEPVGNEVRVFLFKLHIHHDMILKIRTTTHRQHPLNHRQRGQ
jgi:hypothetical protein